MQRFLSLNIRYKEMAINRPLVIKRGWEGNIEVNSINTYIGEWVVFKLPLSEFDHAEVRMPVELALEQGLVVAADRIVYSAEDFEDEE